MRHPLSGGRILVVLMLTAVFADGCDDSPAASCVYNSDCDDHELCSNGRCVPECRESRDCPNGEPCIRGACGANEIPDARGDDVDSDGQDEDAISDLPDFGPRPGGYGHIEGIVHFRLHDETLLLDRVAALL